MKIISYIQEGDSLNIGINIIQCFSSVSVAFKLPIFLWYGIFDTYNMRVVEWQTYNLCWQKVYTTKKEVKSKIRLFCYWDTL